MVWLAGGGCWWNLLASLVCVVVKRYVDFLKLLIPTPLVSVLFCSSITTYCSIYIIESVDSISRDERDSP